MKKSAVFWGYIWDCVECGFKRRNRDSYYIEYKRAEKRAKRYYEDRKEELQKIKMQRQAKFLEE